MKDFKFTIISIALHGLLFASVAMKWNKPKEYYMDSEVLLMGPKTGDKINPEKKPKQAKQEKVQAPVNNDPDALKVHDKNAPDTTAASEGSFGQGGTKELDYNTELSAWIKANKKYPKLARRLAQECDKIAIEYKIYPDGRLDDINVTEKCQYDILNQAAVDMIKDSSPFKPFPANLPQVAILKKMEIAYKLVE